MPTSDYGEPMTLDRDPDALDVALHELAGVFGDGMTAMHVGGYFSCGEAERIADVLRYSGHWNASEVWLHGHAEGDSPGDLHDTCKHCDAVLWVSEDGDGEVSDLAGEVWCSPDKATEHEGRHG